MSFTSPTNQISSTSNTTIMSNNLKSDISFSSQEISSHPNESNENEEVHEMELFHVSTPDIKTFETWDELNIHSDLMRGIYTYGFETPSPIQKKSIMSILDGNDIIAQAQSGTGKTGAFSIGSIGSVDLNDNSTQVIILAHTHELVHQIYNVVIELSTFMKGLRVKTLIGGVSVRDDINELKNEPPHIVIGCTGRVFDMIKRKALHPSNVKLCVLDEADELLSSGFKDNIYNILQFLPSDMQIALFSATMPETVLKLTDKFLSNPKLIIMKAEELNLDGIEQYYLAVVNDREKYEVLKILFGKLTFSQTIIYVNTVARVSNLFDMMTKEGFSVCAIHSNMTKTERNDIITNFRKGKFRVLISSNLTARGIDIQQVNTIINFDICRSTETYLHRIGRSGRFGRKGVAVNLITRMDLEYMRLIESKYKVNITELPNNYVFR